MKQKRPFKGLLVAILLLCSTYANAYDFSAENEEGVTIYYNIISSSEKTVEVTYGGAQRNATDSYVGDIVIPETTTYLDNTYSVAAIGDWAFYYCSGLTSFTLGNSVIEIGEYAFTYCSALTEIIIPDGVTTIGKTAFSDCSGLISVTIGNSVTSIGNTAFSYCKSLKSIYSLNPEPPECGSSAFYEVDKDACTLYVPIGSHDAYAAATRWSAFNNIVEKDFVIEGLHNDLLNDIETVQETLEFSWNVITTDYSDVANEFESEYTSLVEELNTLLEELEEAYNNGTLDEELAEKIRAKLEEIIQQMKDLLEAAEQAEANYLLYTTLVSEINGVETTLDEAWETITSDYADVADDFKDDYESILEELTSLLQELEDAYNDGTLDEELAEEIRAKLEEIKQEIEELLVAAKNAHDELDGIESVSADNAEVVGYYTIDGKAVDAPQRGVNIVKYSDGSTKKVLVK